MAQRLSRKGAHLNALGPRLRVLREDRGLSQAELARMLQRAGWDIDPIVLNKIESRRRTLTDVEIFHFAEVLKLNLGDLRVTSES